MITAVWVARGRIFRGLSICIMAIHNIQVCTSLSKVFCKLVQHKQTKTHTQREEHTPSHTHTLYETLQGPSDKATVTLVPGDRESVPPQMGWGLAPSP